MKHGGIIMKSKVILFGLGLMALLVCLVATIPAFAATAEDITNNAQWIAILTAIVPYLTAGMKKVYSAIGKVKVPFWLTPIKPIIAGLIISSIGNALGVKLPVSADQVSDSTIYAILASGMVIGTAGAWVRNMIDNLKKQFGPENLIGQLLRAISGAGSGDPAGPAPTA